MFVHFNAIQAQGFKSLSEGEAITKLKGPVSMQMVLRALIDEGLKWERYHATLANIEGAGRAVREVRSRVRRPAAVRTRRSPGK